VPYFIWDVEVTWDEFVRLLHDPDPDTADYWLARGLRDAKPDDIVELVDFGRIAEAWPRIAHRLGRRREFWRWWLQQAGHAVDP